MQSQKELEFYKTTITNPTDPSYERESTRANPENKESNFASHKIHVIRNSITYNLCLAMTAYNEKYVGTTQKILIEGRSKNNDNILTGYTKQNMLVNFEDKRNRQCQIGDLVNVHVTKAYSWHLYGEVTDE